MDLKREYKFLSSQDTEYFQTLQNFRKFIYDFLKLKNSTNFLTQKYLC